jgi:hypothetical protein
MNTVEAPATKSATPPAEAYHPLSYGGPKGLRLLIRREADSRIARVGDGTVRPLVHLTVWNKDGKPLSATDLGDLSIPAYRLREYLESPEVMREIGSWFDPMYANIGNYGWKVHYTVEGTANRVHHYHIALGDEMVVGSLSDDMFK